MKRGFTLIEVLVVIGLVAVIATISTISLLNGRRKADLDTTVKQVASLLREAQSNSASQSKGAQWGVHFDNTNSNAAFYSLFYSANGTYASSTSMGQYELPSDICYATSSVAVGSSTDVIFSGISGGTSAAATITFQLMGGGGCATATSSLVAGVIRSGSGKIFFDDFNRANL